MRGLTIETELGVARCELCVDAELLFEMRSNFGRARCGGCLARQDLDKLVRIWTVASMGSLELES